MAMTDNSRGALYMMVSMAAFTLNDTAIKTTAYELPVMQAVFIRGLMVSLWMLVLAAWMGALRFRPDRRDLGKIALRTAAESAATVLFLTALFHMPIANVTAILQSLPLAVTLAAALFLKAPVGWRRLLAILVGFAGVLIIIRPGPDGFDRFAILALLAVACVVVRDLSTRQLSGRVPSVAVAMIGAWAITLLGGIATAWRGWHSVSPASLSALALASLLILAGYLFSVMVMRVGDIAFVTPFRYTGILWAILTGLLVFGEVPDPETLLGIAIVVSTGLFMFHRERRLAREAGRAARAES